MNKFSILILFFLLFDIGSVYATCRNAQCLPESIRKQCIELMEDGCIDWENHVLYAVGIAAPNPKFTTKALQYANGVESARVIAQRNLLQMVDKTHIMSAVKVENMGEGQYSAITSKSEGLLKRFGIVGKPSQLENGAVMVVGRLFLADLREFMDSQGMLPDHSYKSQPSTYSPKDPATYSSESGYDKADQREGTTYKGLVIDARGLGVKSTMFPRIWDQRGQEVFGYENLDHEFAVRQGAVGYTNSLRRAKNSARFNFEGQGPLIIKAAAKGNSGFDIVLSNTDADLLRKLNSTQTFIREGRVMVVID